MRTSLYLLEQLAEGPGVARGEKNFEKKILNKKNEFLVALKTPRPPLSFHKKCQLIRSSRLVGYRQHIYLHECLVLL